MPNIFVISDTHFYHDKVLTFRDEKGDLCRPNFTSIDHMNAVIVDSWNSVVKPDDKVYHLGDVVFGGYKNIEKIMPRLLGKKRLVMGNHDYEAKHYYPHFKKVMSWRQLGHFKKFIVMTHFPLDPSSFDKKRTDGKEAINIHGHLHHRVVPNTKVHVNVSVEMTNYKPVALEDIIDGRFTN